MFTPDRLGDRQGRSRRPPRVLRPCPRPALPGPRPAAGGLRRGGRAAERVSAAGRGRRLDACRAGAVDGAGGRARACARRSPAGSCLRCSARRSRIACGRARAGRLRAPLRRGAADGGRSSSVRLERDLERGVTGLGPHLDDVAIASGGARAARVRLAGRAAPRRARAAARGGGAHRRSPGRAAAAPSRRRAVRARSVPPADPRRTRRAAPGRPSSRRPTRRCCRPSRTSSWRCERVEPLGDEIRRELGRFGPQGAIGEVVAAWPAAVGPRDRPQRVAGALPARRDASRPHARRVWAFELTQRAGEIQKRLPKGWPA